MMAVGGAYSEWWIREYTNLTLQSDKPRFASDYSWKQLSEKYYSQRMAVSPPWRVWPTEATRCIQESYAVCVLFLNVVFKMKPGDEF